MKIEGDIFNTLDIAVSGIKAHSKQVEIITSNLANVQTTNDAGTGQPYRRLEAIFESEENGSGGVKISEIVRDMGPLQKVLKPGHPDADENGYVLMPNINWPLEMINLNVASRAYQANTAMLKRYQKMVESSLELLK